MLKEAAPVQIVEILDCDHNFDATMLDKLRPASLCQTSDNLLVSDIFRSNTEVDCNKHKLNKKRFSFVQVHSLFSCAGFM